MALITIAGYALPDENLTEYSVKFAKVYGSEIALENGFEHIEQVRGKVPIISLTLECLPKTALTSLLTAISTAEFTVAYNFDENTSATMHLDGEPNVSLSANLSGDMLFTVKLKMRG